ncbi:nicotinamide riboside transporter PnuC [Paraglaciecola chathamensis]|uniref:Nicotinamide riboside transporter PnuC n=1 Tax=Paraglaciecola chathamensis S18K6 TaxID=1127672 RepID=A0AAV3UV56_9ALTE|nr:nicotinamide riboside transporter PnuC [Paraglaciecola chathamensis]GAC08805.1 nicotinamide mononucleotide transporter [Paraglaciecola chathamensis S18K6]
MSWLEWLHGFAGASAIEWIATVAGFLSVFLLIRRSRWSFVFGFIQVSIYSWIFFDVRLYSDMGLHVIYIGFQLYGWHMWSRNQNQQGQISPVRGNTLEYVSLAGLAIFSSGILGYVMSNYTDASFPYVDAFTTCASLIAQWLLSHRKLFNWTVWIIVDIVAIAVYWQKGLYPTSALYFCFLIMASIGQYAWIREFRHHNTEKQTNDLHNTVG